MRNIELKRSVNMKTKTKKALSLLLALVLVLSAVPFTSAWASVAGEKEGGYTYSTYNGGAYIYYYDGEDEELVIPDTLGGCPVVNISEMAFRHCSKAKSISIPATVKEIEKEAFRYIDSVETITFRGDSQLETIGANAFQGCRKLEAFTIPAGVKSVGQGFLEGCYSLKSISVEDGNEKFVSADGVLFNSDKTELIVYPAKKDATSYTVPASVEELADYAFEGTANLTEIKFEENSQLKKIYSYAFVGCKNLESITIPKSVISISILPFTGCEKLESIGVEEGNTAYVSIDGVLMSKHKDGVSIAKYPEGKKATTYTIPAVVTGINYGAFFGNSKLVTIDFEEGSKLKYIGQEAFESCSTLTSISLPKSLTTLGGSVFMFCRALKTVTFESGCQLESISGGTFSECASLEKITIPASVKSIGGSAFYCCSSLTSIDFEEGSQLEKIYTRAFDDSGITSITIPASVTEIGAYAFNYCCDLTSVTFKKDNSIELIENSAFRYHNDDLVIYGYTGKYEETYANENDIHFIALDGVHSHNYELRDVVRVTCTQDGTMTYRCYCGETYTDTTPATGHSYFNGVCLGCGELEPQPDPCSCSCHKSGFSGFFWKIKLIFYRLFRTNEVCQCGAAHY